MTVGEAKDVKSTFVSIPGIVVLLVASVLSAYFNMGILTVFLFVMLLISSLSHLWGRKSLSHLEAETEMNVSRAFPGTPMELTVSVRNEKLLPLIWLEARYFPSEPEFLESPDTLGRREAWIMPYSAISWDTTLVGKKRGVVLLDKLVLSSGDGFGLSSDSESYALEETHLIVIYPHVFPIDGESLLRDTLEMHPGKNGYIEDYTLFRGSRDYSTGDSSRFINWRVLARQQKMTVNLFEPVVPLSVTFILDLKSFSVWEEKSTNSGTIDVMTEFHEEKMEEMISLTASAILALTERKVSCALLLPLIEYVEESGDKRTLPGSFLRPDSLEGQVPELLEALSRIQYHGENSLYLPSEVRAVSHLFGETYVVAESQNDVTMRKIIETMDEYQTGLLVHDDEGSFPLSRIKTLEGLRRNDG